MDGRAPGNLTRMTDTSIAPVAPGLLRLDDDGIVLLGGWSPTSGRAHFPLAVRCPWTGADDVEPIDLPSYGRLWSWTVVTTPPPGYFGEVPYGVGVVELDVRGTALRVVGQLRIASPNEVAVGQQMRTVAISLPAGEGTVRSWAFEPTPDEETSP